MAVEPSIVLVTSTTPFSGLDSALQEAVKEKS